MTPSPSQPPLPRVKAGLVLTVTLAALSMIGPFTIDTIFPGYASMGEQFGASTAAMQQVTSVYLLSFAVMSVFHGPLSDALGRRPVMLTGLAGYVVASIGCALAPTLGWLLVGRVVQGMFAGAATIVSRVVIRDLFSGPQAQRLMSQVMMVFAIAPAIAPVIGGWVLQLGPWPGIFWFVAGYGVLAAVLVVVVLPETHPPENRQPLRVGPVLSGLWLVAKSGPFERLAFCTAFTFASYFLYVVGAPIVVVVLLGKGEQDFWMLFVPMIGGMVIGSAITNRMAGRIETDVLVDRAMMGVLAAAVVNIGLVLMVPQLPWVVVGPSLLGIAMGIVFPVLQLAILDLFPQHRGTAASMASLAALLFNAALAGLIVPLVTHTLLSTALASTGFAALAVTMWVWHRRANSARAQGDAMDPL